GGVSSFAVGPSDPPSSPHAAHNAAISIHHPSFFMVPSAGEPCRRLLARTHDTHLSGGAGVAALAAVRGVGHDVDALASAAEVAADLAATACHAASARAIVEGPRTILAGTTVVTVVAATMAGVARPLAGVAPATAVASSVAVRTARAILVQ